MREDTQAAFDRLGDWERVIASHFSGEDFQEGPKEDWDRVPGYASNQNPSVWEYVHGVEKYIQDADPSMFGGAAPGPADARPSRCRRSPIRKPPPSISSTPHWPSEGDKYEFGAEAEPGDANPTAFDRSELTQWAAHQAGIEIPDGSAAQYLDLKAKGLLIPVDQAAHTPGALLFTFSSEPTAGGERPTTSHVAISQGNGKPSRRMTSRASPRWTSAAGSSTPPSCPVCRASPPPRHRPPCRRPTLFRRRTRRRQRSTRPWCCPGTRSTRVWTSAIPTRTATMTA